MEKRKTTYIRAYRLLLARSRSFSRSRLDQRCTDTYTYTHEQQFLLLLIPSLSPSHTALSFSKDSLCGNRKVARGHDPVSATEYLKIFLPSRSGRSSHQRSRGDCKKLIGLSGIKTTRNLVIKVLLQCLF